MPLSEFSKLAKGKQKSARQNSATFSAQPSSSLHGSDFVELVWENGQVVMQGQPSRGRKHSDNISSLVNLRQKGSARGENPEMGGVGMMDSIMNDFQIPDPPELDDHDDIVPWLTYHIDDEPAQQNFACDFFSELSGLTAADPHPTSLQNFTALPTRPSMSQLDQVSAVNPMQTQRRPSSTVMNFPHFAAMVKPSLDAKSSKANPSQVPSGFQESRKMDISPKQAKVPHGKTAEPLLASSVCSGSSGASKDPTYGSKRKNHESEDSDCPTEEAEEESVGINKASKNRARSGSKRIRAAEVHNLSERRRRDRINEKMRALQELIPNCNKVDKASMLDEAIEYLKTLQFQVQMMSMGSGFFMPPMMLPHIPRFAPMAMGYGYGMLDMNGNSFTHPLVQMSSSSSSVPGTRFLGAQVSGLGNLNVTPPTNLAMFGSQGQGVAMPMPQAPPISFPTSPPIRPVQDLNTKTSAPTSQSKEPEPSTQS